MPNTSIIQDYISTINEVLHTILIEVKWIMAESKAESREEFWLFHNLEKEEIVELRKFIDPDLDLSSLRDVDKLIDRLYHLLK